MPLEKLSRADIARYRAGGGHPEYVAFLSTLSVGEGGWTTVEDEGVSRQTIKNRLSKSAQALGVGIAFKRSPPDRVVFEITEAS